MENLRKSCFTQFPLYVEQTCNLADCFIANNWQSALLTKRDEEDSNSLALCYDLALVKEGDMSD